MLAECISSPHTHVPRFASSNDSVGKDNGFCIKSAEAFAKHPKDVLYAASVLGFQYTCDLAPRLRPTAVLDANIPTHNGLGYKNSFSSCSAGVLVEVIRAGGEFLRSMRSLR